MKPDPWQVHPDSDTRPYDAQRDDGSQFRGVSSWRGNTGCQLRRVAPEEKDAAILAGIGPGPAELADFSPPFQAW